MNRGERSCRETADRYRGHHRRSVRKAKSLYRYFLPRNKYTLIDQPGAFRLDKHKGLANVMMWNRQVGPKTPPAKARELKDTAAQFMAMTEANELAA